LKEKDVKEMKKRIWIMIVMIVVSLAGCGGGGEPEAEEQRPIAERSQAEESAEDVQAEPETEAAPESEEDTPKEETKEDLMALLGAIQPGQIDSLKIATDIYTQDGLVSSSLIYQKGADTRTEVSHEGMKQIVIVQAEEGITYQYQEGSPQGMKIVHGDADEMMEGFEDMDAQMEMPDFDEIGNQMNENMIVRREKINGQDAIYIEFSNPEQGLDNSAMKMWYSEKYGYPIVYELVIDGEMMMRTEVTAYEVNLDLDDALFQPPAGIEFMEISMEGGFAMPEMPAMPESSE
jgi:outer membrane lipoprotein-sorting protein/predicted small lipoprotein YifL